MIEPVIDLASRRPSSPTDNVACRCGSGWWTLRGTADTPGLDHGAVAVANDGRITGYAGELFCLECGEPIGSASPTDAAF